MSSNNCAVSMCKKSRKACKTDSSVSFHRFPRTPSIRAIWIKCCGRMDKFNVNSAVICSDHFTKDDFEGGLRSELMADVQFKKILKRTAVPTVNVLSEARASKSKSSDSEMSSNDDVIDDIYEEATEEKDLTTITRKYRLLILEFENLRAKSNEQEIKIKTLQKENSVLKKALFQKNQI